MTNIIKAKDLAAKMGTYTRKAVPFGISGLDKITEGFTGGDVVIVSGRPGEGKTTLARDITKKITDTKKRVCWFSYEEPYDEFFAKCPDLEFYVPEILEDDGIDWVRKHMEIAVKKGIKIFVIDNFQWLTGDMELRNIHANHANYREGIVKALKSFARKNNVAIILLVHVKRADTKREPNNSDLKDTSALEQIASVIIFISRKEGQGDELFGGESILRVTKCRHNGKTGRVSLLLRGQEFVESTIQQKPATAPGDTWD